MKYHIILCIIFIFLILAGCESETESIKEPLTTKEVDVMKKEIPSAEITIIDVYDNVEFDPEFKTGFGFGCIVKLRDKTILFDTGGDSSTLLANLETAGINPEQVDIVVLSHIHGDHTGGLSGFIKENPNVSVYLPASFPDNFKDNIKQAGAEYIEITGPEKIIDGVYTTGELGTWIKEQSLVVDSDKGLIVITGCAHPGIVNIVRKAKELSDKKVYLVLGGFHLGGASASQINNIISDFKELGVEKAAPSHCTGETAIIAFEDAYKDQFIKSGVGRIIEITEK